MHRSLGGWQVISGSALYGKGFVFSETRINGVFLHCDAVFCTVNLEKPNKAELATFPAVTDQT